MIFFVTPAYQRFELTALCLDQRADVIRTLARHGVQARCVVIADDDNLDLARARGFDIVERDNEWLGRKFNDGIQYAAKHGADWIVPIGSDSWIDPAYFLPLPTGRETRTSPAYCAVTGTSLAELSVGGHGAGPYMFPRRLLARSRFRPAKDEIIRHVDSSTIRGIGQPIRWKPRTLHPFQYIGFRGTPTITSYKSLVNAWGVAEHPDPWSILGEHYPPDLVERARILMTD